MKSLFSTVALRFGWPGATLAAAVFLTPELADASLVSAVTFAF